jgi:hypothetical protein
MKTKLILIAIAFFSVLTINAQWKKASFPNVEMGQAYSVISTDKNIYVATNDGIFLSDNNGTSFSNISTGIIKGKNIRVLAVIGKNLFAGTYDAGMFMTTDNKTWKAINTGLTSLSIQSIYSKDKSLYVGTKNGLFVSENNGTSWKAINNGLGNLDIKAITGNGINLYVGTFSSGIYTSTDNGNTWTAINGSLQNRDLMTKAIAVNGNSLYLVNLNGIYLSTDNGNSWKEINSNMENTSIKSIVLKDKYIVVGSSGGDIFVSADNGINWEKITLGPPTDYGNPGTTTTGLTIFSENIYASQDRGTLLWTRPTKEIFK